MTTQEWPHRVRGRLAWVAAFASSAFVMPGLASEPNEIDGFSQLITAGRSTPRSYSVQRQLPMRLPSITADSATLSKVTSADTSSETEFDGGTGGGWKTKMVFERLELRAANGSNESRVDGALQNLPAESETACPSLSGGVTMVSDPGASGDAGCLPSNRALVCAKRARSLVDRGTIEYGSGDWFSAEANVWEACRCAAEGIDLQDRELAKAQLGIRRQYASRQLQCARNAIHEARVFARADAHTDGHVISRMVINPEPSVLDAMQCDTLTGRDAADCYLDAARVALAGIASRSAEAARGMDLLAAIYLKQNDSTKLNGAIALCLRRAALQGQPGNARFASRLGMHLLDLGLMEEARRALSHSLSIQEDDATTQAYVAVLQQTGRKLEAQRIITSLQSGRQPANRTKPGPPISELSPRKFVASPKRVMLATAQKRSEVIPVVVRTGATLPERIDVGRDDLRADPVYVPQYDQRPNSSPKPNVFKRFAESFKKRW